MMERETDLPARLAEAGNRSILTSEALAESAVLFMEPLEATIFERWEVKGMKAYTAEEIQSLRDYLESGGFIYLLTHGSASRALIGAKRLVQRILPETSLTPLSVNHPIYRSYFQLEGPLAYPYRRGFHEDEKITWLGATLHGRLAILVDTEETLHVVDQWIKLKEQSRIYTQLAPAAAARLVNVIIYAVAQDIKSANERISELRK
ncbi:MAG: DUF4159 domain-containing protein [Candidatus Poribacteria bacterium]|nr:DUF4159 domain-containing protein [Candidatus Poribacteria bacterium]